MKTKLHLAKGFTMAELLIVVAIIAVLVAVAIPVFGSQLEKAREAADESNLRALYAELTAAALTGETGDSSSHKITSGVPGAEIKCSKIEDGKGKEWTATYTMTQQTPETQSGQDIMIGGQKIATSEFNTGNAEIVMDANGNATWTINGTKITGTGNTPSPTPTQP